MTISLFGLPGAGKSYFLTQQERRGEYAVSACPNRRRERYSQGIRYAVRHPVLAESFLFRILSQTHFSRELLIFKLNALFVSAFAIEESVREKANAIVDEGLFQLSLWTYERKITKAEAKDCLRQLITRGDCVWLVEADKNIRQERMQDRKRIPRSKFGLCYVNSWFSVIEYNYEIFKEIIQEECVYQIIRSSDEPTTEAVGSTKGTP